MLNYIGYLFLGFLILVIIGLIPLFKRLKQLIKSSCNNFNNYNNLGEKLVVITENYEDEAPYSSRPIKCSRKDFEDIKDATNFVKNHLLNNYLPFANTNDDYNFSDGLLPEDLHQELLNSFDDNDSAYISTNETGDSIPKYAQSDNEYVFTFTDMNLSNNFNGNNINNSNINIQ